MGKVKSFCQTARCEVEKIYVEDGGALFEVDKVEDLQYEAECVLHFKQASRLVMEDACAEIEETALSKKLKASLRKACSSLENESLAVGVNEIYSPPRITKEPKRQNVARAARG